MAIKMLCFDLDGTLLTHDKRVSDYTLKVLAKAVEKGIHIVPTTGRLFLGLPEAVRSLPGLRYAILINGAVVYDAVEQKAIHRAEVDPETADRVYAYMDTLPIIYDCFADDIRYVSSRNVSLLPQYVPDHNLLKMILDTRSEVPDLRAHLRQRNKGVQKLQGYFRDQKLRADTMEELKRRFPGLSVTTSLPFNCEINDGHANKGEAMDKLCAMLGIDPSETMGFGDGSNDMTLIQHAGIGVAMKNAIPALQTEADYITDSNDEDGVAKAICKFCDICVD